MKKTFLTLTMAGLCLNAMAQTTVTFKPGPVIGEDAKLFTTYNCTLSGQPSPSEYINDGNSTLIDIGDWTFTGAGCQRGTARSLIRFRELNTIPPGMYIVSAELRFYGLTSTEFPQGNSNYPGSPLSNNIGWVKLIPGGGTYAWDEATVNFSNRPTPYGSTVFGGWVTLPASGTRYDWNTSVDVTDYVQRIVTELATDPTNGNNGFMIELQTEAHYRSMIFASSDFADSTRWPELEVTYAECNADFTYCIDFEDFPNVSFTADNPGPSDNVWYVDGFPFATTPNTELFFWYEGTYQICLDRGTCFKCIDICIDDNIPLSKSISSNFYNVKTSATHQRKIVQDGKVASLQNHRTNFASQNNSKIGSNTKEDFGARLMQCNPNITYCISTEDPLKVHFSANAPGSIYNIWTIYDYSIPTWVFLDDAPTYEHDFTSPGVYNMSFGVFDAITGDCGLGFYICVAENALQRKYPSSNNPDKSTLLFQGKHVRGNDPYLINASQLAVSPNPTSSHWNIEFQAPNIGYAQIILYDLTGKKITEQTTKTNIGKNNINQTAEKLNSGIYFIEVRGEGLNLKGKVIKN